MFQNSDFQPSDMTRVRRRKASPSFVSAAHGIEKNKQPRYKQAYSSLYISSCKNLFLNGQAHRTAAAEHHTEASSITCTSREEMVLNSDDEDGMISFTKYYLY